MMTLEYLFYWYYVLLTATVGGKVYATGDWRLPQSTDDFGNRIETRWNIAGTEGLSSCYVWVQPENGYHFAGIVDENNQQVCSAEKLSEIRLWCETDSAKEEDGIVSGNDFYPVKPQKFTAVFLPDSPTGIALTGMMEDSPKDLKYDLSGRKITTPRGGQIVVWNKKKVLVK
jgi:hypothetical protein